MGKNSLTGPLERISWDETLPTNTDVEFQVAFSNDREGPWSYIGPDGTSGTVFTTAAGEDFDATSDFEGRYARFKAVLSTSDGLETPSFGNVHLSFSGEGMLASEVRTYAYDEAGNIESITTVTDAGTATDGRTHNDLNQVTERVVGGDTWTFSYDDNGNMTGKSNGTDTWVYTFSDENRLVRVQGPGGVDVSYSYDSMGRMLTRDDGGPDITKFWWDHWECIKEVNGESETIYHAPQGAILSFTRGGNTYQAHSDALSSTRMITDEGGSVIARYEYSAFGEPLSVAEGPAIEDFPMRFIGARGVRSDFSSGLIWMRERWYDPTLGRFISRDPVGLNGGTNRYSYCFNDPINYIDPFGLDPGDECECLDAKAERVLLADYTRMTREKWGLGPDAFPNPPDAGGEAITEAWENSWESQIKVQYFRVLSLPMFAGGRAPAVGKIRASIGDIDGTGLPTASQALMNRMANRQVRPRTFHLDPELGPLDESVWGRNTDNISHGPRPSRVGIIEEFLHGTQRRLGIIKGHLYTPFDRARFECHVKNFMIRHREMLGLTDQEVALLAAERNRYIKAGIAYLNQTRGRRARIR